MEKMTYLIKALEDEINELNELYDFYLDKMDSERLKYYEDRLKELRIEIRTYEKVLDKVGVIYGKNN